jgi:hypothetical protein
MYAQEREAPISPIIWSILSQEINPVHRPVKRVRRWSGRKALQVVPLMAKGFTGGLAKASQVVPQAALQPTNRAPLPSIVSPFSSCP